MKYRFVLPVFAFTAVSLLTGCLEQGIVLNKPPGALISAFSGDPTRLASLALAVTERSRLTLGDSVQLEVRALDAEQRPIDPTALRLRWVSQDDSALRVDQQGRVTGLQALSLGQITVTDTRTQVSDTGQLVVSGPYTGDPTRLERLYLVLSEQSAVQTGDRVDFDWVAVDTQGRPIDPDRLLGMGWRVAENAHFQIDDQGVVTVLNTDKDQTTLTLTHAGTGKSVSGALFLQRVRDTPSGGAPQVVDSPQPAASSAPSPQVPMPSPSAIVLPSPESSPAPLSLRLQISPERQNMRRRGDRTVFVAQATDAQGQAFDLSGRSLSWRIQFPEMYALSAEGSRAEVTALKNSGLSRIYVTDRATGAEAEAVVAMVSSGGGGGGGGGSVPGAVLSEPALDEAGYFYAGGSDGRLYAYDSAGSPIWQSSAGSAIVRNPALWSNNGDEALFFGTASGQLHQLMVESASNTEPPAAAGWPIDVGAAITTAPLIQMPVLQWVPTALRSRAFRTQIVLPFSPLVVVGDAQGVLHAYDFGGTEIWSHSLSASPLRSSPVADANGNIYVGTAEGAVCRVQANGDFDAPSDCLTLNAPDANPGAIQADPVLLQDNSCTFPALVVGSSDGHVYKVSTDSEGRPSGFGISDDLGAELNSSVVVDEFLNLFVPVDGDLVSLSEPDFQPQQLGVGDLMQNWRQPVCTGGGEIVGAPLLLYNQLQQRNAVLVTCTDGNLYRLNAADGEIDAAATQRVSNDGERLVAGPAFGPGLIFDQLSVRGFQTQQLQSDPLLAVGSTDAEMRFFSSATLSSLGAGNAYWPKFRYDAGNTGQFGYSGQICVR